MFHFTLPFLSATSPYALLRSFSDPLHAAQNDLRKSWLCFQKLSLTDLVWSLPCQRIRRKPQKVASGSVRIASPSPALACAPGVCSHHLLCHHHTLLPSFFPLPFLLSLSSSLRAFEPTLLFFGGICPSSRSLPVAFCAHHTPFQGLENQLCILSFSQCTQGRLY